MQPAATHPAVSPDTATYAAATAELDLAFYQRWYTDLARMTPDAAAHHWSTAGQGEGRAGNYSLLLEQLQLRASDLPPKFSWVEYIALNPDLPRPSQWSEWHAQVHYLQHGILGKRAHSYAQLLLKKKLNREDLPKNFNWQAYLALNPSLNSIPVNSLYLAEIHYLEQGAKAGLKCWVDLDFYNRYYGLPVPVKDAKELLQHYRDTGSKKGYHPSFAALLEGIGFSENLVPAHFDFAHYLRLNPWSKQPNAYELMLELLTADHVVGEAISSDAKENMVFYKRLGLHHEKVGDDGKARLLYAAAHRFAQDGQLLEHLGNVALRAGQKPMALAWYLQAEQLGGHSAYVFANGVMCLREAGRMDEALEMAQRGVVSRPADAGFMERLLDETAAHHWDVCSQRIQPDLYSGERQAAVDAVLRSAKLQYRAFEACQNRSGQAPAPGNRSGRSVLIVGDTHTPQCVRYRIDQKLEQLKLAGYRAEAVSWDKPDEAAQLMPWFNQVIFYRVPALPAVIKLIASARCHGKTTFFEVDDLLVDPVYPHGIETYGGLVDAQQFRDLIQGMALMRAAAQLCDYGLASTVPMQRALEPLVRTGTCYLHRNALDSQSPPSRALKGRSDKGYTSLFYGSGTKSHNSDFITEVLPAIDQVLGQHAHVKLTVVGYLELPAAFLKRHAGQVLQMPPVKSVQAYWSFLASSDINLAVLTPDPITDCKSELKWFEAACFGVPSVVSATQNYLDVIRDGEDGFIARDPNQWHDLLCRLIQDPALRRDMGARARERVMTEYGLVHMAGNICDILRAAEEHMNPVSASRAVEALASAS